MGCIRRRGSIIKPNSVFFANFAFVWQVFLLVPVCYTTAAVLYFEFHFFLTIPSKPEWYEIKVWNISSLSFYSRNIRVHPSARGPSEYSTSLFILYVIIHFQNLIKTVFIANIWCALWVNKTVFMSLYCKSLSGLCACVCVGRQDTVFIVIVKDSRRNRQTEQAVSVALFFPPMKTLSLVP